MFIKVRCEYSDKITYYNCFSFEELYNALKQINDEHILTHIHLEFYICESTDEKVGEITIPFETEVIPLVTLY